MRQGVVFLVCWVTGLAACGLLGSDGGGPRTIVFLAREGTFSVALGF